MTQATSGRTEPPERPEPAATSEGTRSIARRPQGLGRSTAIMAAGTMLSRLTGFAKLVALAYALGFTRLADTYNLANVTPNIIYELVLGGVLTATLVPLFAQRLADDDEEAALRAISAVVTVVAAVLAALTLLFVLVAPWVIRVYTLANNTASAPEQRAVATTLLRMFAPQVAFYGAVSVATALLNVRRRFAVPMFAPVLNNLVVIGVLVALPHLVDDLTLDAVRRRPGALALLGLGTTAGVVAMAVPQILAVRRAGIRLRFRWEPGHEAVRTVVRLSGWTFGFVAANQVALWAVLVLANRRGGDLTAYQAAMVFFLLPHGIFAVSVMTALQPDMAEDWAAGRVDAFRRRLGVGLRTIAVIVVPAAVGYLCLARPIVSVALEHGALGAGSARTTADILALLAIGLPGFSVYMFLVRAYQSMQDTRTIFLLYLAENAANVLLALALYPSMGVRGLGVAFALAYWIGSAGALVDLGRRIGGVGLAEVARSWARVAASSAVMAAAVLAVAAAIGPALLKVGLGVAVGLGVYLVAAWTLGVAELLRVVRARRPLS